jgi:hypothetical protein
MWWTGPVTQPAKSHWEWSIRNNGPGIMFPVSNTNSRVVTTYHGSLNAHINDPNPYDIIFCDVKNDSVTQIPFHFAIFEG